MKGKLLLVALIALGVAMYMPDSRTWILERAEPALTPVFRWQTNSELEKIARDLQMYERENMGRLPAEGLFLRWLENRYQGDDPTTDSWGNTYSLLARSDSFRVVSYGPDGVQGTPDDLTVVRPRDNPSGAQRSRSGGSRIGR